ncbi:MAG: hypothetical protein LPL00_08550 [Alphaproteobacteria bacterium]|mgnify:CR=1 FL=1|nr:hypothetical protein [Alphaproteobacteria bacterium]MDX5369661.1 hypothetical protein [Alphaproteobacteria bacterium]MDX5464296.1 hypothetical protein [Alphaproteobacteria bacterium]
MTAAAQAQRATVGWLGFATGAAALIATLVVFWAGPFAPHPPAGVTIGELAAEIARSAARSVAGQPQPEPVARALDIDDYLEIGVGVLAGLAIVLGVAALIRHERRAAAVSGIALGGLAVGIQLFTYTVMLIAGALVLSAIVYALRDAFADIFGGLFDG